MVTLNVDDILENLGNKFKMEIQICIVKRRFAHKARGLTGELPCLLPLF